MLGKQSLSHYQVEGMKERRITEQGLQEHFSSSFTDGDTTDLLYFPSVAYGLQNSS